MRSDSALSVSVICQRNHTREIEGKMSDTNVLTSPPREQDNSNWMKSLSSSICDTRPITDISIPGSHDSITYSLKK